jgi:exopolyphosphatase/guanosine-5'-triphosphate,3'-diphosphate pyrophosphatase
MGRLRPERASDGSNDMKRRADLGEVALVELGSNAVRLILARVQPGERFRVLREERVQTRLGSGRPGTLPRRAVEATVAAVRRFLGAVGDHGARPRVMAVATSAVREAVNREQLLEPLRRTEGIRVRVLSGPEEARLGAIAVRRTLPFQHGVIADLGGGSLQITRLRAGGIVSTASLPLGSVRLTRRFLLHDPPPPMELRALRGELRDELVGALPPAGPGEELVGLGGTVRALARFHLHTRGEAERSRHGLRLWQSDVVAIREWLEPLTVAERQRLRGLKAERADIILAGAVVIEELMTFGGYRTLIVGTCGVRDGLLFRETFDGDA